MDREELSGLAKKVFDDEIEALLKAKRNLDGSIGEAVELIVRSRKFIVSGVGKSGLIGKKIASTFSSIGIPTHFLDPVDALHGDIGIVEENDVILLLSKSGSTEEIVRLVPYLKGRKAKIIAITGNGKSYLQREADICLNGYVEKEACPLNIVPTSSTTVALVLGDALAVLAMNLNNVTIEDFSKQHPLGQIGRNTLLQVSDVMHKEGNLPLVSDGSKFRDAIIEITNKGLGCVCIVDEQNKLTGIITDGDVRRTLQKYDDIRELTVNDVMTSSPATVYSDEILGDALSLMESRTSQISVLPVIDPHKKCVGVVRIHDIIRSGL